jgi:hypothetical protein
MRGHTPGPWRLEPCSHGGKILRRGDEDAPLMARHPQGGLQIVPEADAHLIAAAPELLEALREALPFVIQALGEGERGLSADIKAAIKKAEGA